MTPARIVLGTILVAAPAVALACVLADPPPITSVALERPRIDYGAASPPLDQKILAPPASVASLSFVVPVEVAPDQQFQWRVFVDLDPTGAPVDAVKRGTDDGGALALPPDAGDSDRMLTFSLSSSDGIDFSVCHHFTIVVALAFKDGTFAEPVTPPGGDLATWFYEPVADCTLFDGGPPIGPLDGGVD